VTASVSIVRTASTLPDAVVTNEEIGERLVADVQVDDEAAEAIVAKVRERSALIEKKTGLRARRFFEPGESPVTIGLELLERLMAGDAWSGLDALIVSSSSTQGFPGLSQQIVAAARTRHADLGDPFVLDIGSNACTSFMYGVTIGASTLQTMGFRRVACLAVANRHTLALTTDGELVFWGGTTPIGTVDPAITSRLLAPGVQFPALQPVKLEGVLPAGRNVKKVHTASHSGLLLLE